ncbi:MAG: SDR family NAD(P)-dependent oxidoreductase [Acidobacteriota bacterium]
MKLEGKGVLVTGAASGLGAATARWFHARGARVILADRDRERGEAAAAELGAKSRFVETDVTNPEAAGAAVRAAVESGGLHVLVNCAGIGIVEKVVGREGVHDLGRFEKVIRVNLIGTFNMLRTAAYAMTANEPEEEGERGVIVNTASIAAYEGQMGQAAYSASKGGVAALTLPAARDLARHGIRVVTLAPGLFDTPLLASVPEEARQALAAQTPFPKRLGRPDEFAAMAEHVVRNSMLNGVVIRLDGALRMV